MISNLYRPTIPKLSKYEWIILILALSYAFYWQLCSPIQYTGDSEGYLGIARMLLGQSAHGIAPIYRAPGYPILLVLTGVVFPGTFIPLLFVQALCAGIIPVIIYRILTSYGSKIAFITAMIVIFTGTTTIHSSQVMSESLFTLLLFIGLSLCIKVLHNKNSKFTVWYWFAFTFAALNAVRPIAWLIFWLLLLFIAWSLWRHHRLMNSWKNILGAGILFMCLMSLWGVIDDILFSNGAHYSPLVTARENSDNFIETYVYDLPFLEAYFSPWTQRVNHISSNSTAFGSLHNKPAMRKIHDIVLNHIKINKHLMLQKKSIYPYQLFGKYANQPQRLADQIFTSPNYAYANFVRIAMEQHCSKKERLSLYYSAAKEANLTWPKRWLTKWITQPLLPFTGPSHGNGSQKFLVAYSSLRHFNSDATENVNQSLVSDKNGPASLFLFTSLEDALQNNPELWRGTKGLFGPYVDNTERLSDFIIANPNQNNAWDISVMIWDLMGYDTMSLLLDQVANEAFDAHKKTFILRFWETLLMVIAGPGYVEFDNLYPQFGQVEIYDYLETQQLTTQQKNELRATQKTYQKISEKWRTPITCGYLFIYLCKPFFLITSLMSIAILWSRNQPIEIPIILMLPYIICVTVYGALFTALPRYTDPTILLPMIVTCMTLPQSFQIYLERKGMLLQNKNKRILL